MQIEYFCAKILSQKRIITFFGIVWKINFDSILAIFYHLKLKKVWGEQNYDRIPISNVLDFQVNGLKDKFWSLISLFQVKVFFYIFQARFSRFHLQNLRIQNLYQSHLRLACFICAGAPGLRPTCAFLPFYFTVF